MRTHNTRLNRFAFNHFQLILQHTPPKKINASLNIFHEENTKNLDYFLVDNKK